MSRRRRVMNAVASELTDYFLTADTDQGMQSSWSPLVDIAMGGFGGSPDAERRVTDRRFGPSWRDDHDVVHVNIVERARQIRNVIRSLPPRAPGLPSWYDVLYVAHGSIAWRQLIDRWFGKPTGMYAERFLPPPLLGVSMLTDMVRADWAAARAQRATPVKPGVLVTSRSRDLDGPDEAESGAPFFAGRTVDAFRRGRVERAPAVVDNEVGFVVELVKAAVLADPSKKEKLSRAEKKRRQAVSDAAKAKLGLVKGQAIVLLAEAEKAYRSVRGALPAEEAERMRAEEQAAKQAAADEPVGPRFASRVA